MSNMKDNNGNFDLNSYRRTAEEKKKTKKKKSKRSKKEKIIKTVLICGMVGIMTFCIVIGAFLIYVFNFVDSSMDIKLDDLKLNCITTVYVQDDEGVWQEFQRLHGSENRIWVSLEEIPPQLQNAFIAIEDKRFETHGGIDWKRTFAAFANYFLHFYSSNQGGSTITQQLVKNLTGDRDQSPARKIREIMRARELELTYSKDTIKECYLNIVAMANGISGVEVAANYYFDKSVGELSLVECASLAAITKSPEYYRPDLNPENNKERRDTVLYEMYKQGYITREEYDAAVNEELVVVADDANINKMDVNSYFVDALIEEVVDGLVEYYKCSRADAEVMFYNGGYQIYSTMKPNVQEAIESVFENSEAYALKAGDGSTMQGAMTVMDYSGHIVGMVGGIGEKEGNRGLNRATMISRQPGSTMKPISAYAPAIENNIITYSTIVDDKAVKYGGWTPVNWYRYYKGNITVKYALEISNNTIPVWIVNKFGANNSYKFLKDSLGLSGLNPADADYAPLGMGGTNGGLNTTASAAAFAIFGNQGKYYNPTTYYSVTDANGNTILQYNDVSLQAIGADTATVMNRLLRNVVYGAEGTAGGASGYINNMSIYAKTGTSDATNDLWFVGGTPYYVASAWCGYDMNETINNNGICVTMWGKVMQQIHKNLPAKSFKESQYTSSRYYCEETGLIATENCTNLAIGYYKNSYLPYCSLHEGKLLAPVSGGSATASGNSGVVKGTVTGIVAVEKPAPSQPESSSEQEESSSESESSSPESSGIFDGLN